MAWSSSRTPARSGARRIAANIAKLPDLLTEILTLLRPRPLRR
jgi:hypothetical protein